MEIYQAMELNLELYYSFHWESYGGGYPEHILYGILDTATKKKIFDLYGKRDVYDVIPDGPTLSQCYPKLAVYHLVVDLKKRPDLTDVLYDYTTNKNFFKLNVKLNLLNQVDDKEYFDKLMLACLGSYQLNLPDVCYRFCNLDYNEYSFYEKNCGSYVIFKSFTSTSKKCLQSFGDTKNDNTFVKRKKKWSNIRQRI